MKRFLDKVEPIVWSGCWQWMGALGSDISPYDGAQYGQFFYNGKCRRAHRVAYELFRGEIPQDKVIDHICRNRTCVNPDHLEAVTSSENIRRSLPSEYSFQKKKTHCTHGHEYTAENTFTRKDTGWRCCRTCYRQKMRDNWQANKHMGDR